MAFYQCVNDGFHRLLFQLTALMRLLANAVRNTPAITICFGSAPDRAFPAQLYRQLCTFLGKFILFCPVSHSLYLFIMPTIAYINLTN